MGAFTETFLKKYFSSIVEVGQKVADALQEASPSSTGASSSSSSSSAATANADTAASARARIAQDQDEMYSYCKDAATGRVRVPDVVDLFNKVTYEVLANTVLGSEWMSLMTSFGECGAGRAVRCGVMLQ